MKIPECDETYNEKRMIRVKHPETYKWISEAVFVMMTLTVRALRNPS